MNETLRSVIVDEYDLPFIDTLKALPSHVDMAALGMGASDGKHLQAAGQQLYANIVVSAFKYASALQS